MKQKIYRIMMTVKTKGDDRLVTSVKLGRNVRVPEKAVIAMIGSLNRVMNKFDC